MSGLTNIGDTSRANQGGDQVGNNERGGQEGILKLNNVYQKNDNNIFITIITTIIATIITTN